ncbi:MAG TPA: hypothetical protein VGH20_03470 [Myxococcales bacterium]|jgi:hypothetical protein
MGRILLGVKVFFQRLELWNARRDRRRALAQLSASLPPSSRMLAIDGKLSGIEAAFVPSRDRDRADWSAVPAWARWLVVLRGVFDRLVLRALRFSARRERDGAAVEHALACLDSTEGAALARTAHERVLRAEAALQPLPGAVKEAHHFSRVLWNELRGKLVPRMSGLAGLAAGFWIAQTFTDSQLSATLHSFGFGSGPRHAVSRDTLRAMSFWLPLLAAAVCSYAGTRLSGFFQSRYGLPEAERQR